MERADLVGAVSRRPAPGDRERGLRRVTDWRVPEPDLKAILGARHGDPFAILGVHDTDAGIAVRAFVPNAEALEVVGLDGTLIGPLGLRHSHGFFEGLVPNLESDTQYKLRARNAGGVWEIHDPYAFGPVLGSLDDYLLAEGTHQRIYERLGAHLIEHQRVRGVHFAVWAPNARRVAVVGDFNGWDGRRHQMRKRLGVGVWEIFAPELGEGVAYKYEIVGSGGELLPLKADPVGFSAEMRPSTASMTARIDNFSWHDEAHLASRAQGDPRRKPIAIYEVHLGSWQRSEDNRFLTYDELGDKLIPYAHHMGFTHLELMPISEHPLDISWGYQPVGLFAPTRRFGDPAGFARFVDRAHQAGISVLLDWVPAHFPVDAHGLSNFDGTALYDHADPRKGFHPDWNTAIFNFGRREVSATLVSNAVYWLDVYHVDGLRVDAVASMLYLDYSRQPGEWIPNDDGSNENRESVAFLRRVNELTYSLQPGTTMIAEESTAWPGVSAPTYLGGLGFGFKWNMGWMHDTLDYMSKEPVHRQWHHHLMTFGMVYAFTENFVLPLSHDEVVHGKRSIIGKMPGDEWQRFANLRAYYGFMWGMPGKKLLFMGQEFAQSEEWNAERSLDWHLTQYPLHSGVQSLVRQLNHAYRHTPALHERDCEPEGFQWVVGDDAAQSVYAWLRFGGEGSRRPVLVISNMTPVPREGYRIGLPHGGRWDEILNTDAAEFGGSGIGNMGRIWAEDLPSHGHPHSAAITIPPLATIYLEYVSVSFGS
jgi:1,4-alpha-glucan branching enzyme